MVARGTFREDLYFRLAGLVLELPSLRERGGDVTLLARSFLSRAQPPRQLGEAAARALEAYAWPGNVRELRNAIERALALHPVEVLEAEHLMLGRPQRAGRAPTAEPASPRSMEQAERDAIVAALRSAGGNKSEAARLLGISRPTLREKIRRYGIPTGGD
jgi:DNA-binding NtrC family response regulator